MRAEVEVQQGVHSRVDDENDAAAAAAVAAIGSAQRLEFLAVDRRAAVTAGTRPRVNDDAIDKPRHRGSSHPSSVRPLRDKSSQREHPRDRQSVVCPAATMLTVLRPRLTPNSTAPASLANNVSSPPRPTPVPGWNLVPRWRTRISPAWTTWPPNRLTPRRWAGD